MAYGTVELNPGTGGNEVAVDAIAGSDFQRVKLALGAEGTAVDAVAGAGAVGTGVQRVTLASDDPAVALLTTIDTDTGNLAGILTAVQTLDNAIAGNEMQVDIVSSAAIPITDNSGSVTVDAPVATPVFVRLSDGSSAIATLPVSLASVPSHAVTNAGTFATQVTSLPASTNTIEVVGDAAENAAAAGNPVQVGGRYDSTPRTLGNGDVGALAVNASGQMLVEIAAGAGSGGTAAADDADFTAGTTSGTPIMGSYQSSPTAVTDGDMGIIGITADREVKVSVTSGGIQGVVEDAAAAGGEEGIMVLAVRRDTPSSGVGADGDFAALSVDSNGALRVSGASGTTQYAEDAAHTTGDSLCVVGAVRRDTAAVGSGTDGDYSTLNVNSSGRLYTSTTVDAALPAGTNNIGDVDILSIAAGDNNIGNVDVVSLPALPTGSNVIGALTANQSVNVAQMNGVATTMGNGASGTGVQRVTIANDSTGVLATVGTVTNITNQGQIADDAAFTPATTRVMMAGFFADETATDSVDEGDGGAARMTLDRKQIVTPYAHASAGGITAFRSIDVDETEDEVKASAGKLFWIHAINLTASVLYLKVYNNTAAGTTVGTTTPVFTFPVPTLGDTNGAGFYANFGDYGVAMSTGICVAATTALADADTGAPAANALVVNAGYL